MALKPTLKGTWLDGKDAAGYLGVTRQWLRMHSGRRYGLPAVRLGHATFYRLSDLQAWLESTKRLVQSGLVTRREIGKLTVKWSVLPPRHCR